MILFIEHETWPFLSWPMRQKHFQWARYDLLFKIYYIELALLSVFVRGRRHSLKTFLIGFHRSTRFAGMGPSILIAIHSGYGEFIRRYISRKLLSVQLQVLHCRVHNFCVQITLSAFLNNLFFFFFLENSRVYCFIYTNNARKVIIYLLS